jgi:hypothetical protein
MVFKMISPFYYARGPIMTHMPRCLAVRGWRRPNHSTVCTVGDGCTRCWVFTPYIACELGSQQQGCVLANQRQKSLKEENGGGLTSSSFGRLRCRKSPARGFWMY